MHKMFLVLVPLLFSLFSYEGRTQDVASVYLERHTALLDAFDLELSEPSSELKEDQQLDFVDYERRLLIPAFSYIAPLSRSFFVSKQTFSHSSIRAPPQLS